MNCPVVEELADDYHEDEEFQCSGDEDNHEFEINPLEFVETDIKGEVRNDKQEEAEQALQEKSNVHSSFITDRRIIMKRKRNDLAKEQRIFFKACIKVLTNEDTDPFGIYVGKKLKTITCAKQKIIAETLITNILQKALFNKLTENTVLIETFTNYPSTNSSHDDSVSSYFSSLGIEEMPNP